MTEPVRDHDLVVYGATGFVGVLTAEYLARQAPPDVRIALGGRSQAKLEQTRAKLGVDWPLVIADSQDRDAVAALAESARVVATTVGPYFKYGKPLVEACAAAGTHYADLTGEVLFMRWAIDAADAEARASGARIVHTCGFDSIPSDIGTLLLHEEAQAGGHGELEETFFVVKAMKGGASGGTIDSARTAVDTVKKDPSSRRVLADPYALSPDREAEPDLGSERDSLKPFRDDRLGGWMAPFVMGSVNTRVVRRSNALRDHAYGRQFRYRELMLTGGGPLGLAKATGVAGGLAGMFAGLRDAGCSSAARPRSPGPRRGTRREHQGARLLQYRHPRNDEQRQAASLRNPRPGRPRLQGDGGHARRKRALLGARRSPRRGGCAHARFSHGPRSRRPPHRGGAQLPRRG